MWGAQGGGFTGYEGGKGGFVSGEIDLVKGTNLYIYVGGHGEDSRIRVNSAGGWNGRRIWYRGLFR